MKTKNLTALLYLKKGSFIRDMEGKKEIFGIKELAEHFNDNGVDNVLILDLSREDNEHEENLGAIKKLCRHLTIPAMAGGNIKRLEDIKKLLYGLFADLSGLLSVVCLCFYLREQNRVWEKAVWAYLKYLRD